MVLNWCPSSFTIFVQSHGWHSWSHPHYRTTSRTRDGYLTARTILGLDLRGVRLACLSACETARGHVLPDGVMGLPYAFLAAGAQCVVASLWKVVNDDATSFLMRRMYVHLVTGMSVAAALRQAMSDTCLHRDTCTCLSDGHRHDWRDPKFWGAFQVIGNGDVTVV